MLIRKSLCIHIAKLSLNWKIIHVLYFLTRKVWQDNLWMLAWQRLVWKFLKVYRSVNAISVLWPIHIQIYELKKSQFNCCGIWKRKEGQCKQKSMLKSPHVSGFPLTCLCVRPHCRCWSLFSWVLCVLMRILTAKVSHHLKPDCLFAFGESVVRWDDFILRSSFSLCPHNLLPCPNRVVYEYVLMWHLL